MPNNFSPSASLLSDSSSPSRLAESDSLLSDSRPSLSDSDSLLSDSSLMTILRKEEGAAKQLDAQVDTSASPRGTTVSITHATFPR